MDDPSFLAGRSSYAKARRRRRMNVCKCGAIMHNNPDCKSSSLGSRKTDRLEFVKRGRVALWGETPVYKTWVRWCEQEYGIYNYDSDESDVDAIGDAKIHPINE
ncbi:RNA binding protein [Grapevine virus J]|uniref:RNA binding protein n=1 Tax=Grapevine virus J TaxID=2093496 RepID=A0A2P1BXX1_9VIRU|nr:RNA binding protein [Grapevine virus J]AVI69650.1 RNA binding protein [Grapevine virus J]